MTVARIATVSHYVGQAADSKPTAPAGSLFWETDTGRVYIYDGSAWAAKR